MIEVSKFTYLNYYPLSLSRLVGGMDVLHKMKRVLTNDEDRPMVSR